MYADFVQIVAGLCNVKVEEVLVVIGSEQDKKLQKSSALGQYPMLELENGTLLCDSLAIASFLARSSGNSSLLGSNDAEMAQVDQLMQFLREETTPIVRALQWYTFGHVQCTAEEYNFVQMQFKSNVKVINNYCQSQNLKQKKYLVGDNLTVSDVYLTLTQVEMQQALIDPNLKNSLEHFNVHFKNMTQNCAAFQKRMGAIKVGKKQLMPLF